DEARMRALVERQIAGGVGVLVPCGTTGEAATLTPDEQMRVLRITIDGARGRARVLAGVGTNSTAVTVERATAARAAGADAVLVVAGDDAVAVPLIALGAEGIVSVISNEAPDLMARLTERALQDDWATARELHYRLLPLMEANFIESNPGPVKAAMALMG